MALTEPMDLPGHQFLARPALALDEHREIGCRNACDVLAQSRHRGTRANERRCAGVGPSSDGSRSLQRVSTLIQLDDQRGHLRKTFIGTLLGLEDGRVRIEQNDKKGGVVAFTLEEIALAQLEFEF